MATIYRVSMTTAEYNAYIAVPTNTVPNNYQILITDAPSGTPNLYTGTGTNTPASGTSGGAGGNALVTNWTANTSLNTGQIVLATVAIGGFVVGEHISSNTSRTTGATFNTTEAGNFTSVPEDTTVAKKTDFTDGSIQALLDTLRTDSVHFLPSTSSVDTLTTTGWYNIQNATGGPAGGGWYYYYHGTHRNSATGAPDTNYGFQLAKRLDAATNNLLMRVKTANSWTAWATLATIDVATTTVAGLMSAADKTKLDGVATSAAAVASTGTPAMDGTAALGTGTTSARADHIHPSDTSRFPQITISTIDANSTALIDNTVYHGMNTGAITNGPSNAWAWTLHNLRGGTWRMQVVFAGGLIYTRSISGTFSTAVWATVASTADIPALSSTTPVMDGTAAIGTGTTSARADHVHGSDTSRAPLASPTFTGTVSGVTKTMIGLGSADNTADTAKPVSTAQQTAFDLKADNTDLTDSTINARFRTYLGSAVQFMASGTDLNTLTGVGWYNIQNPVNGPTTTTWYYVENVIHRTTSGEAVDSNYKFQRAITLTDTGVKEYSRISIANSWTAWIEIANIGDLATYAPLASPTLTGTPTAPTATAGTSTTQLATTAFAMVAVAGRLTHISQGTLDANSAALTDNAVYTGNNTAAMTNAPTAAWAWALFNFRMGTWRTQIWVPAGGNIIYKRTVDGTFTGATWQSLTFA